MRDYTLLDFSLFGSRSGVRLRISAQSYGRLRAKLKWLTRRNWPLSLSERLDRLKVYLRGWPHYFAVADGKKALSRIDQWLRARIRMCLWKQWKVPKARIRNLVKLGGIPMWQARQWGSPRRGYWGIAHSPILTRRMTIGKLQELGYYSLRAEYARIHST